MKTSCNLNILNIRGSSEIPFYDPSSKVNTSIRYCHHLGRGSESQVWTNQRLVFRSRDQYGPIRDQYSDHLIILKSEIDLRMFSLWRRLCWCHLVWVATVHWPALLDKESNWIKAERRYRREEGGTLYPSIISEAASREYIPNVSSTASSHHYNKWIETCFLQFSFY